MRKITYSIEPLINLFHTEKVLNLEQIKAALGSDVKMTAFRKLKLLTYKASYSHAGKYYTLDEIADFNNYGIWEYHHIYFSKFGTLKNTIEQLVCSSEAGYTAIELEQLLKVRVFKPLYQLYSTGRLYREQIGDSYVYGCANNYELQQKSRIEQIESSLKKKIVEQSLVFDNAEIKESLHVLLSSLNEKQRRLYVGFESMKFGYGGDSIMSHITGMNIKTIGKGRKELQSKGITPDRVRNKGDGRRALKKTEVIKIIEQLMEDATAGDPMSLKKWTRKSPSEVCEQIRAKDIQICTNTVSKFLQELDYSLKSNKKMIAETQHPDRNQQFEIIAQTKQQFKGLNYAIISVDAKKKESVGNFKNAGQRWCRQFDYVFSHDFRSYAIGIANPYGIYEVITNYGTVVIGTSYDTPEFSVESIELWLVNFSFKNYVDLSHLLVLCDSGGSNSYRARAWKYFLYKKICQPYQINVTVCHYPPGASKWNPVEHRLFSFISKKWAGVPLRNYDIILEHISETKTKQGLKVNAILNEKLYQKGIKIRDEQMKEIKIEHYHTLPKWNYTIYH